MTHDVYICHSPDDEAIANAICTALEQDDIRCWIAPRDLVPGAAFVQSTPEAISTARLTLLVLTDSSNSSHQVRREIEHSASHGVPVLLFRMEDVVASPALEQFISDRLRIDAVTAPLEQHLARLVGTVLLEGECRGWPGDPRPRAEVAGPPGGPPGLGSAEAPDAVAAKPSSLRTARETSASTTGCYVLCCACRSTSTVRG